MEELEGLHLDYCVLDAEWDVPDDADYIHPHILLRIVLKIDRHRHFDRLDLQIVDIHLRIAFFARLRILNIDQMHRHLIPIIIMYKLLIPFGHFGPNRILIGDMIKILLEPEHLQEERSLHHNLCLIYKESNFLVMCDFLLLLLEIKLFLGGHFIFLLCREMELLLDQTKLEERVVWFFYLGDYHRVYCVFCLVTYFEFLYCDQFVRFAQLQIFII